MASEKVKRIEAFKKLMEIAKSGSVELYGTTEADIYSDARSWPVHWEKDLGNGRFENEQDKQRALNYTLECLVTVDFPSSVEQLKKEKELTRLILDAGADPNHDYRFHNRNIFDDFLLTEKHHMALEVAKTKGFLGPGKPFKIFDHLACKLAYYLEWKCPFPGGCLTTDDKEKTALYIQDCSDQKEIVYTLFQKGIYPCNQDIFTKLVPIVLEKDPEFFDKRKEQTITQLKHAKTPVQIYKALMGKRKEKN